MISSLSLPTAVVAAPATPTVATGPASTPGFAQALHAADQPADAAPEPAPEGPAARSTESPQAQRTTQAPRSPSRPPVGTAAPDRARASAGPDTESQSPDVAVSREADPLVPPGGNDGPPSLLALLAGWQPPSDAVPGTAWGASAPTQPQAPFASTTSLPVHAAVRGGVRLEPASAVAAPAASLIAGDGTSIATGGSEAATPSSEASTSSAPPAITSEALSAGPVVPSSPPIPASATQAAPATPSTGVQPATQAQIAASPHSAAFGPELGAQISTFVRHGVERAQLQLHPAEMGPVTVQILVEGANAQVRLWAEQPGTRQALEQAMPALAGQLREGGLTLTGGGVFEQPREAPEQSRRETGAGAPAAAHPTTDPAPLAFAAPARRRGLVDLVA